MKTLLIFTCCLIGFICHAQAPHFDWMQTATSGYFSGYSQLKVDRFGNIYVLVNHGSKFNFGNLSLTSLNTYGAAVLLKLHPNGQLLAHWQLDSPVQLLTSALAIDETGQVYFAGMTSDSLYIGSELYILPSKNNTFIAKITPQGIVDGVYPISTNGWISDINLRGYSMLISGTYFGSIVIGGDTLKEEGDYNNYLALLNTNGSVNWVKGVHGENINTNPGNSTFNAAGEIWYSGNFEGDLVFGKDTIHSDAKEGLFMVKCDQRGNILWNKVVGGTVHGQILPLQQGEFLLGGNFQGTASFDGRTVTALPYGDGVVAHYDKNGNFTWLKTAGGPSYDYFTDVVTDQYDNSYAVGVYQGTVATLGGVTIQSSGASAKAMIMVCDQNGDVRSAFSSSGNSMLDLKSIAVNKSGEYFICGKYLGGKAVTFANLTFEPFPPPDEVFFIAKATGPFVGMSAGTEPEDEIRVFPNPFSGHYTVDGETNSLGQVDVVDVSGKLIYTGIPGGTRTQIDLSESSAGIYFLKVQSNGKVFNQKLVKVVQE